MSKPVYVLKLVSGEEIVAAVDEVASSTDFIVVSKARSLYVIQTGPETYALQLAPFLKGAPDDDLEIGTKSIITMVVASAQLERSYLSQTSNIEIASSLTPLIGA